MEALARLIDVIKSGRLVDALPIDDGDVDRWLELRDDATFSRQWMSVDRDLETRKKQVKYDEEPVTKLRELVFEQVFARWRPSDLAAYISDDFGLVGDALLLNVDNSWLNGLFAMYSAGVLPHGNVAPAQTGLAEQIGQLKGS
jgi:hypothetical protein